MERSWEEWLAECFRIGSDPVEIRDILLKNYFTLMKIKEMMGDKYPKGVNNAPPDRHYTMPPDMYQALSKIRITKPAVRKLHGKRPIERIKTDKVQLYVLEQFLSKEECAELCAITRTELRPSTIASQEGAQYFRTSSTCELHRRDHPLVKNIDQRMADAMGINLPYSDEIEAQLYRVGQEFKPHTDTFPPLTDMYQTYAGKQGNRTWTFMIYLECATAGGGTEFTKIERTFNPKPGTAIIWNNLHTDGVPNDDTMHAGQPVLEGEKVVITKWFRERGEGPMFMDPLFV